MATGGRDEQATVPAPRGLLATELSRPTRLVNAVLEVIDADEGSAASRWSFPRWRRAGLVVALVLAVGDALVVTGLVAFDIGQMALGAGRWIAKVVPA